MRLIAAVAILLGSLGDILLSLYLRPLHDSGLLAMLRSPGAWLGVMTLICHFLLWMQVLARLRLSVAQPISALYYVYNALLVGPLLHQMVPPQRWLGILLIVVGVLLVSSRGEEPREGWDEASANEQQ